MNKFYSSLVLAATLSTAALAQPTITSAAMPQIGYVFNMASDTAAADLTTFSVSAGSATTQTWDYSGQFNFVFGETTSFVTPSSGQGSSNFPNATLAVAQPNGTDWVYFAGNSNGLYIDGAYVFQQGTYAAVDLTPNSLFLPTPGIYGFNNNAMSTATFTAIVSSYTVQVRHSADRTVSADAFGSLTTPTGTYPNTLRFKTFEKTIDSVFLYILGSWNYAQSQIDSTLSYNWVQNTQDALLMQINMNGAGTQVKKAQYLQSFSSGIATYNNAESGCNLYPNPTSSVANLSYENKNTGIVTLQMFDMSGRLVGNFLNENQGIGNHKISFNVEAMHLPKGLYFLRLRNSEGVQNIKLVVE